MPIDDLEIGMMLGRAYQGAMREIEEEREQRNRELGISKVSVIKGEGETCVNLLEVLAALDTAKSAAPPTLRQVLNCARDWGIAQWRMFHESWKKRRRSA